MTFLGKNYFSIKYHLGDPTGFALRVWALGLFLLWSVFHRGFSDLRSFPIVPFFTWIDGHPITLRAIHILMTLFLFGAIFYPKKYWIWILINICYVALVLLDQLWVQGLPFYGAVFALIYFKERGLKDKLGHEVLLGTMVAMNACFYFWAGISKLNFGFWYNMLPWSLSPFIRIENKFALGFLGIALALFEILTGVFLLFPKTRPSASYLMIAFHLSVFLVFGPLGLNYHMAILPMSFMQIFFLLILKNAKGIGVREALIPRTNWGVLIRVIYLIFPLFSVFGYWNDLLAFRLYSNSVLISHIYIDRAGVAELGKSAEKVWDGRKVPVPIWSIHDTDFVYLDRSYYQRIFQEVCKKSTRPENLCLSIDHQDRRALFFLPLEDPNEYLGCKNEKLPNCDWISP